MRTRTLGNTGLRVSELCMGCWQIGGLYWGPMDVKACQWPLLNRAELKGIAEISRHVS